jgi:hypothetical protein
VQERRWCVSDDLDADGSHGPPPALAGQAAVFDYPNVNPSCALVC